MPFFAIDIHNQFTGRGSKSAKDIQGYSMVRTVGYSLQRGLVMAGHCHYWLANAAGALPASQVHSSVLVAGLNWIETLSMGPASGAHRNAMNDPLWQALYNRHQATFRRYCLVGGANTLTSVNLHSYPCYYCGLVVPEQAIEVDHQKPKGGGNRGAAVLKVFRAIGGIAGMPALTTGAAAGHKNQQINAIAQVASGSAPGNVAGPAAPVAAPAPGAAGAAAPNGIAPPVALPGPAVAPQAITPIPPKGRPIGGAFAAGGPIGGAKANRYTLNAQGRTMLTVARMVMGRSALERSCLNSVINLVPSCTSCNGAKTNHVFYV